MSPNDELTPRELIYMKDANEEREWAHTSCLMAMICNTVSKRKRQPDDFNPLKQQKKRATKGVSLKDFKEVLLKKKPEGTENDSRCRSRKR